MWSKGSGSPQYVLHQGQVNKDIWRKYKVGWGTENIKPREEEKERGKWVPYAFRQKKTYFQTSEIKTEV